MKRPIKLPFFEIGIKNYFYGDDVLKLAQTAEKAAEEYDIDVMMIVPFTEIRRVAENTNRLIIFAPHMDTLRVGRGLADILPEAIKAAGADGVVLNHSEKPLTLSKIEETIQRADELDLLTFACADTIAQSHAIAGFHPNIINPEPKELIGSGKTSSIDFVNGTIQAIKTVDPKIIIEQAAGITTPEQVAQFILAGADGVGVASGIAKADDPQKMICEMVKSTRKAADLLKKKNQ